MSYRKIAKSATQELVDCLLEGANLLAIWTSTRSTQRRHELQFCMPEIDWDKLHEEKQNKKIIENLKYQKRIQNKKQGMNMIISMQTKTVIQHLKQKIKLKQETLPVGQICLSLFDFPVSANSARKIWREFLLSNNFQKIQLSAWGTNIDIKTELSLLIKMLDIEKWVKIIIAIV